MSEIVDSTSTVEYLRINGGYGRMKFELDGVELINFLQKKTDLHQKFSSKAGSGSNDAFFDFCVETIDDQAEEIHSVRIAFRYYDDIDCYYACVMEYQGIYFVRPGPEHDPIGYFFNKDKAIEAANTFATEVYDDDAEEEYKRMQNESD